MKLNQDRSMFQMLHNPSFKTEAWAIFAVRLKREA